MWEGCKRTLLEVSLPWKMKKTGIILPSSLNLVLFLALESQQKMLECNIMSVNDVIRLDFLLASLRGDWSESGFRSTHSSIPQGLTSHGALDACFGYAQFVVLQEFSAFIRAEGGLCKLLNDLCVW